MSLNIGQVFGDYEVLEVLGSGGMGKVYKVRNTVSGRIEAVKVLLPGLLGEAELADRFLREIRVHASLDHPNITRLHTAQRLDDQILLVMEYVQGTSLEALLHQGNIPLQEGIDYACQALAALSYAHGQGVVHRDIKPSNMMLTTDGVVKLMDFGIAKAAADPRLTQTGLTLGSLYYMSPEQIKGVSELDARCDLYSFGVSLYEIVTGKRPFGGDSAASIMQSHLEQNPVPPLELDPELPASLNEIILMSVAKDPAKRFQTADAFRNALQSLGISSARQEPAAVPVQTAAPASPAAPSPPRQAGSRRGLYMLVGSLATILIIVLAAIQIPKWLRTTADVVPLEMSSPLEPSELSPSPVPAGEQQEMLPAAGEEQEVLPPMAAESEAGLTAPSRQPPPPAPAKPSQPAPSQPSQAQPKPVAAAPKPPAATLTPAKPSVTSPAQAQPAAVPAQPPAASPPAAAGQPPASAAPNPATVAALRQQREQMMLKASRIAGVKSSLDNMRREQQRSGLGMRGDITAAEQRLEFYMDEAQSSLEAGDPEAAEKNLSSAETQLGILERFLGR